MRAPSDDAPPAGEAPAPAAIPAAPPVPAASVPAPATPAPAVPAAERPSVADPFAGFGATGSNPTLTDSDPVVAIPGLTMPPPEFMLPAFTYQDEFNIEGDNALPPLSAYLTEVESSPAVTDDEEPKSDSRNFAPATASVKNEQDARATTISAVLIAFTPWLAAASIGAVLVLRGFELTAWWFWAAVALPYLLTIIFAATDRRRLRRWGYGYPASWLWSIFTAPVYLVARTRAVRKESEHGVAPMLLWVVNFLLVAAASAALGLFGGVAAVPLVAEQIEGEAEAELLAEGEQVSVDCPIFYLGSPSFLGTPRAESVTCAITMTPAIADFIDPAWISAFIEPERVAAVYFEQGLDYSYIVKPAR